MNRDAFLAAADRHTIRPEAAAALYDELYGDTRDPSTLTRDTAAFADLTSLSRTVQVLTWLGTVLVIGAHAWWSTDGYEALGIGVVLALTLVWQAGFLGAAEWARRHGHTLLV